MKKMRKIALPLAIFALGIGSAYASTASDKTESAIQNGFRYDPMAPVGEECVETTNSCSTEFNDEICTYTDSSGQHNLFDQGCVNVLFKVP
ncbi:DUF6520 family protein [Chryseobacterium aquifrigidense]|uniref:Uncharacterized protein n=1 Tax=Chryseobacterium aquifrigidense TaxID=558021 RepID=A0A543EHS6_9FLAO|nr:DUF6520 family protein [Chryseobacterium aquifrigidense]TQM21069.1 hypothetical protein FB551_0750 [Chryseobacterium aquifrigidense]